MSAAPGAEPRTGLGILAMIAGVFFLASLDATAKLLGADYPIAQVVFFRSLFAMPVVLALALASGGLAQLIPHRPWLALLRGLLTLTATTSFFTALRFLPLAEAWTIAFAAPLIVTALSRPLLGEAVGPRRWGAVLVGFAGVLVVMRPGFAAFHWAALLALLTAFSYGVMLLTARKYAASESASGMVFYTTLIPAILAGAAMALPGNWVAPAGLDWLRFVVLGGFGGAAMLCLTLAFRLAPAAVVAPFDYTALVWTVAYGWWIWGDWPDWGTWTGAGLIVAAGIYVVRREARLRRRPQAPPA